MRLPLPFKIAFRYLRSPHGTGFSTFASRLAILGLGLGMTALILTLGILRGFESTLSEKIAQFDGHMQIQHFLAEPLNRSTAPVDSLLSSVHQAEGSFQYTAFIQRPALLRKGSAAEGVFVEGLDRRQLPPPIRTILTQGTDTLGGKSLVMGSRLVEHLGLTLGDQVVLFDLNALGSPLMMQQLQSFTLTGIFHSGLQEYDQSLCYISLAQAQRLFGMEDQVTGWVLRLTDPTRLGQLKKTLEDALSYPYYLLTWKEKHQVLFNWLTVQKWPIIIIFGLIALVGLVNIISAITMIILEKVRTIGTLRSYGLTRNGIRLIYLIKGAVIGLVGSLGGLVLAMFLAWLQNTYHLISISEEVYFMDHVPVVLQGSTVSIIVTLGFLSALFVTLWPSNKAVKIEPAAALRYE